ncbi:putative RNA-directed DNA polymerase from transposon X-element [Trichonephila clavipes]|nr:putative RNA-directed DNA polymerase from transposon X-element [Trichonephila clavipes]
MTGSVKKSLFLSKHFDIIRVIVPVLSYHQNMAPCSNVASWSWSTNYNDGVVIVNDMGTTCYKRFKRSETGLPQGTVISPILFNIFINDLPDLLASDGLTNTALFADDLAIWCSTPKRDQFKLNTILNLTLERLHLWCIENNMTVNLKKTTCQFFTLNRQPFSPQLVYKGMSVQQSDVSIYLGCALDNKLKWTKHAELVVSKARKRLSILKRLTGVKWGCNRDTLNTTYKTYIQPVLNYCNEVLISASENPFTNVIEKNAAILFNRLIRLPNNSFWRDYDSDGGRNLKTQKGFIQCVRENIQYKVINDVPFELLSFANPLDYAILDIRLDLVLNNFRRDLILYSAKLEIKRIFRESFRLTASRVARDKPWSTLCKKSHGSPISPRAAAVAKFGLLTGHDCLCSHLFRFNLVTSLICVLCDTGQDMTAAHLDECSALNDLNCIVKRTATAGSEVVQSGRPIFDDFFQHLWPYISNNTANIVFQMVKRSWLIRIDQ